MAEEKDSSGAVTKKVEPDPDATTVAPEPTPATVEKSADPPQPANPPEPPEPAAAAAGNDHGGKTDVEAVENAKRENRRSDVRIAITYVAAGFLFLVGAAVVGYLLAIGDIGTGKDIFFTILPVAAAIVTYWYAGRKGDESAVKIIEAMRKEIK